ncbi:MAG: hypothetical protein KatS3mg115_2387 [Candidatus Poribacteria bacterium]|nr:MAG: hypothetical protein KatS3mg115_2387 [Candidatus Poribacteria bacterium]
MTRKKAFPQEERRDRYGELARAVIEMAWRDARPGSRAAPQVALEAREFLLSREADFWASVAGIHLHRIRQILDKAPLPGEGEE